MNILWRRHLYKSFPFENSSNPTLLIKRHSVRLSIISDRGEVDSEFLFQNREEHALLSKDRSFSH